VSAFDDGPRNRPLFIMVTGAAGGIGWATTSHLAHAGHVVFAADRREDSLQALSAEYPSVQPIALDVTDRASIDQAALEVHRATDGHGLDVLVNVAGILILGPVEAVPDDLVRAQFDVNVLGLLAVTRALVPPMRERGSGRIVNISSVLGRFTLPGSGVYSGSKFAVEAVSDALRIELEPFGVRVVVVEPGVIDTPLYRRAAALLPEYEAALQPYRSVWRAGFAFPQRLLRAAASTESAGTVIAKAAIALNPRDRYRIGVRNRLNTRLLTALPSGVTDLIKRRITGIAHTPGEESAAR
jgi:NAD(P)-dependent dehydrogenase (short-subunit alcohol dehydrogenase family)